MTPPKSRQSKGKQAVHALAAKRPCSLGFWGLFGSWACRGPNVAGQIGLDPILIFRLCVLLWFWILQSLCVEVFGDFRFHSFLFLNSGVQQGLSGEVAESRNPQIPKILEHQDSQTSKRLGSRQPSGRSSKLRP